MEPLAQVTPITHKTNLQQPQRAEDLRGLYKTVSAVPTRTPTKLQDQIVFYSSGGTLRIYMYDATNHGWHFAALT